MKQDINKNNNPQERQEYVPVEVKVIEVAPQGILCASGNPLESYPGTGW